MSKLEFDNAKVCRCKINVKYSPAERKSAGEPCGY